MINQISLANTFGHFVTAISSLIGLANTLVDGPSFTANTELKLTKPGVTLNVRTNALVSGNLTISSNVLANLITITGPNTSVVVSNTLNANNILITNTANIANATIMSAEIYGGNGTFTSINTQTGFFANATVITLVSYGGQHMCNTVQANTVAILAGSANLSTLNVAVATIANLTANITLSTINLSNIANSQVINCTFANTQGLNKANVGLDQVDNTSDATKNAATANLSNKTLMSPLVVTGNVSADPTTALGIASKQYVDNRREDYGAILNGRMDIWQRGNTLSNVLNFAFGYPTFDRGFSDPGVADTFAINSNYSGPAITVKKSNNVPTFANSGVLFDSSLQITCDTADPTPNANTNNRFTVLQTVVEGYRWTPYKGKPGVLSFWVYSSQTGSHSFCTNGESPYNQTLYVQPYTINAANTWEYKTIQIPAQTIVSNTDPTTSSNTGTGIKFVWGLESSTGFTISNESLHGQWLGGNQVRGANTVQPLQTTGAVWAITGVRYDLGTVPKSTSWRPLTEEVQLCKRYYQKSFALDETPRNAIGLSTGEYVFIAGKAGTGRQNTSFQLPVEMRQTVFDVGIVLYNPSANVARPARIHDSTAVAHCDLERVHVYAGKIFQLGGNGNTATSVGNSLTFHWAAIADTYAS